MQPVSAVAISPPATVAPQDTSIHGQVEIASGALPAPPAAQSAWFADLIKGKGIDEVVLLDRHSQRVTTSKASAALNEAMKHLSESEARARSVTQGPHDTSATQSFLHTSATGADHGRLELTDPVGEGAQIGSEPLPERISMKDMLDFGAQQNKATMMVMEFSLESTLYSKAVEKGDGAINQLVQEK